MIYKTNSVRIKLEFVDLIKQGNCQEKYSLKGWFYPLKQLSPSSKKVFLMFGQDSFFQRYLIITCVTLETNQVISLVVNQGPFTNYVHKFLALMTTYPKLSLHLSPFFVNFYLIKVDIFGLSTYPPLLLNICERPLI